MPHPNATWTDAEIATLRRLRGEGKSFSQCATALGKSGGAVAGQCRRLGLSESDAVDALDDRDRDALDLDTLACLDWPPYGAAMHRSEARDAVAAIWGDRVRVTRSLVDGRARRILDALAASERAPA